MRRTIGYAVTLALFAVVMPANESQSAVLVRSGGGILGGYNPGVPDLSTFTSLIDAASDSGVTVASDLTDSSQVLNADSLILNTGYGNTQPGHALSSSEIANIQAFLATGKRVLMFGENSSSFSLWSQSILDVVGGLATGENFNGTMYKVVSNDLTAGVDAVYVPFGTNPTAPGTGGTALFDKNVATLWGTQQNALIFLEGNAFQNSKLQFQNNQKFAENVANWLADSVASPVPEPTALIIWGLFGSLGLVAARRRRKQAA